MGKYQAYSEYKDSGVGALGLIPNGWQLKPLKYLATIKNGQDHKHVEAESGYPVYGSGGPFTYATQYLYDAPSVLLGRKGTIDRPLLVTEPFWSVDTMYYTVVHKGIPAAYLYYLATTIPFARYSTNTALPSMTQENLGNTVFCVPSDKSEMQAIAAFLDHETAKIDALIEKQQQLIQLLKEKRQAVISHAVTKGLNPNAPMKDSGIEWLGEVPAHWGVCRLKQIIKSGSSISYGIVQPGESLEEGVPFIQTTNISQGTFDLSELQRTSEDIAKAYPRSRLEGGEVILGIRASIGAAFVVPEYLRGVNLSRGIARIIPSSLMTSSFMVSYFRSDTVARYWSLSKQGSTFSEVSIETVRELVIPVPPLDEQNEIVSFIGNKVKILSEIEQSALNQQKLLEERRTALISAAVTGKIDVRHFAEPATR